MSRRNGGSLEKQVELQEEKAESDFERSVGQQGLQMAQQMEEVKQNHLERLMETDMSDAGINLLDNMVDRSFILGNITEAEYHDVKWEMHGMYIKIRSAFPPQGSKITGDVRAFLADDEDEALEPLSSQQRIIIAQMIRGVMMIVSRSKGGFQQEMNVKSINVSEVMNPDDGSDDRLMSGLFGK
jgi:hypothetical protein